MTDTTPKRDWKRRRLGDYFRIKHGYAFKGEFFTDGGDYIVLTPGNFLAEGGLKLKGEGEKYYSSRFPAEFLLNRGDFLVVMTDLKQDAPILGSPAIIKEDGRFLHNQRLGKIVELNRAGMDPRFLYYLFNTHGVRSQIKGSATGATVRHTAPERIYAVEVDVPPPPVQGRIAAILSAYDDLIENNTRRIKVLEEMARALYSEWFVHLRFPCHQDGQLTDSIIGPVPAGWEIRGIGEVVECIGGGTPSTKNPEFWEGGDVTWYIPSDLTSTGQMFTTDSEKKITASGLKKSSARMFPAYSVMVTSRATIGVVAINTKPACVNQGFIVCIPTERLSAYQIYFWVLANKEKIISLGTGATFKEIIKPVFRKLPIVVPDADISQRFVEMLDPISKQIQSLQAMSDVVRRTRDLLLPRLVTGEIGVVGRRMWRA